MLVRNVLWLASAWTLAVLLLAGCGDDGDGSPPAPPTITTHPSDQTVTEGDTASFAVAATGSGTLTYQWKKDGEDVVGGTGETTASYTTPATELADNGAQFTCVVTNTGGSLTSNAATLTVDTAPPTITAHPANQTVLEGETASFTVTATSSGALTYQWKKDGGNVIGGTGGTSVSYTTPATVLADNGAQFTCVVTNAGGSVTSNAATLIVSMAPPAITDQPQDQAVIDGETATFSVVASGSAILLYQWKKDGVDVAGGTGGTTPSYTTPTTSPGDDGAQFTCVVTNAVGSATSNAATLTVGMVAPTVTVHPSDAMVTEGQTATFTVAATGSATLTYQWKRGGVNVTGGVGGSTASYTTPATALADDGAQFTCVVTNGGGSVTSNAATLTVISNDPTVGPFRVVDLATGNITQHATLPDLFTNAVYKTMKLVLKRIGAGSYRMGDEVGGGYANELPVHPVRITRPFYVGVFEVTQRQWFEVMGTWPSFFTSSPTSGHEKCPVEQISWNDSQDFLMQLLSETGATFRLPTEAEWEYVCKAGTTTDYSYGNTPNGAYMWYRDNSDTGTGRETHDVGTRNPNPWGLSDMHGNVCEWCEDWYDADYYAASPADDPGGPASGSDRVTRSGTWNSNAVVCRSSLRYGVNPSSGFDWSGLRAVQEE